MRVTYKLHPLLYSPGFIVGIYLALLMAACTAIGINAQTFNKKLLVGYETIAEVMVQTTNLLKGKKITPDDAENIQKQADNLRGALDLARTLKDRGDTVGADAKLDATRAALVALQAYLVSKEGK